MEYGALLHLNARLQQLNHDTFSFQKHLLSVQIADCVMYSYVLQYIDKTPKL